MASNVIHGRLGVLYFSTSSATTDSGGVELGYTEGWSISMDRELAEVSKINTNSKEYVEGLVSGTVSMNGNWRVSDTSGVGGLHKLIGRFAKIRDTGDTGDSDASAIQDGDIYARLVIKPIDTSGTSDEVVGAAFIAPILSNGFGVNVSANDLTKWTYEGTINGDLTYFESTDTNALPVKA